MERIHNKLIDVLKTCVAEDKSPSEVLMEMFLYSKEAAYRRLRGEILFTLDEAVVLARELKVSLDHLIANDHEDKFVFHTVPFSKNSIDNYLETLRDIMHAYDFVKSDPDCICYIAGKVFSPTFYFKYEGLTKYSLLRWSDCLNKNPKQSSLSGMVVPQRFDNFRPLFVNSAIQVPTMFILNDSLFSTSIDGMIYRYKTSMLTKEDMVVLKDEMMSLLNDVEAVASRGYFESGAKATIYIADTYFDTSYNYLRGNGIAACGIGIHLLNFLSSQNPAICDNHRVWIESLMKYSTSITCSGEAQRVAFFNRQRNKLRHLCL